MEEMIKIKDNQKDFLKRLAANIAQQFGRNCEVAIHEFQGDDLVVTHIENGHVTKRREGDISTDQFFEEFFEKDFVRNPVYRMQTKDGRKLLSSTTYIRDGDNFKAFVCINYDVTEILNVMDAFDWVVDKSARLDDSDVKNVLEYHLAACERVVGKSLDDMDRNDKFMAVKYLESQHVFLITKSSTRVCEYLNITKYKLYTFLDEIRKID